MLRIGLLIANILALVVSKGMLHRLDPNHKKRLLGKVIAERDHIGWIYGNNFTKIIDQHFILGNGSFALAEALTESYFGHKRLVMVRLFVVSFIFPSFFTILSKQPQGVTAGSASQHDDAWPKHLADRLNYIFGIKSEVRNAAQGSCNCSCS